LLAYYLKMAKLGNCDIDFFNLSPLLSNYES